MSPFNSILTTPREVHATPRGVPATPRGVLATPRTAELEAKLQRRLQLNGDVEEPQGDVVVSTPVPEDLSAAPQYQRIYTPTQKAPKVPPLNLKSQVPVLNLKNLGVQSEKKADDSYHDANEVKANSSPLIGVPSLPIPQFGAANELEHKLTARRIRCEGEESIAEEVPLTLPDVAELKESPHPFPAVPSLAIPQGGIFGAVNELENKLTARLIRSEGAEAIAEQLTQREWQKTQVDPMLGAAFVYDGAVGDADYSEQMNKPVVMKLNGQRRRGAGTSNSSDDGTPSQLNRRRRSSAVNDNSSDDGTPSHFRRKRFNPNSDSPSANSRSPHEEIPGGIQGSILQLRH